MPAILDSLSDIAENTQREAAPVVAPLPDDFFHGLRLAIVLSSLLWTGLVAVALALMA